MKQSIIPFYIEVVLPNISPNSQDTDQDGVLDINEDCDQDGLTNYDEEYLYHTDLSNADTDSDGLTDKEEVDYGRNSKQKELSSLKVLNGAEKLLLRKKSQLVR